MDRRIQVRLNNKIKSVFEFIFEVTLNAGMLKLELFVVSPPHEEFFKYHSLNARGKISLIIVQIT